MSLPILVYAAILRPSTQTVVLCAVMFLFCVVSGYLFRWQRQPILSTILLLVAIPWGFAATLFVLDQVGIMDPYADPNPSRIIVQDESNTMPVESPVMEQWRPTEPPRPTATATATAAP